MNYFSKLWLKTRLRCTKVDDRLNGFELLYINPERDISVKNVIAQFAINSRKIDFAL